MLTIEDQTGWCRPHPGGLCRIRSVLCSIFIYDYNISDIEFIKYCDDRGLLCKLPKSNSDEWFALVDFNIPEGKAFEVLGYTVWYDVGYFRGVLQDCWQLYLRCTK